jgi:hypothetical protein
MGAKFVQDVERYLLAETKSYTTGRSISLPGHLTKMTRSDNAIFNNINHISLLVVKNSSLGSLHIFRICYSAGVFKSTTATASFCAPTQLQFLVVRILVIIWRRRRRWLLLWLFTSCRSPTERQLALRWWIAFTRWILL